MNKQVKQLIAKLKMSDEQLLTILSEYQAESDDEDKEIEKAVISKKELPKVEKESTVKETPINKAEIAAMIAEMLKGQSSTINPEVPAAKPKVVKKKLPAAIPDKEIDTDGFQMLF